MELKENFLELNKEPLQEYVTELHSFLREQSETLKKIKEEHEEIKTKYEEIIALSRNLQTILTNANTNATAIENLKKNADSYIQQIIEKHKKIDEDIKSYQDDLTILEKRYETTIKNNEVDSDARKEGYTKLTNQIKVTEDLTKNLNEKSQELLQNLSDRTIHGTFNIQAKRLQDGAKFWSGLSIFLGILAVLVAGFVVYKIFNSNDLSVGVVGVRILFTFALIPILVWLMNFSSKQSSIFRKQADEYTHKATVLEAITGYRKQFLLSHDDAEFILLFDSIIKELINNPSETVNELYGLKNTKKAKSNKEKNKEEVSRPQDEEVEDED
ncbi:MAG: hypothetical protein ACK5LE_09600 [Alphaproteobacteria bacterium]